MSLIGRIDSRFSLMKQMAGIVGVDLGQAVVNGRLTGEDLRSAALRCTTCSHADACTAWLEDHASGFATAPDYCANRDMFSQLRSSS